MPDAILSHPILRVCLWVMLCATGCSTKERDAILLVAGDTRGWITPCGCAANQSGGLARRATLVADAGHHGDVLLLDAGGSAVGTSPYQRLKLESLANGLQAMRIAAHNIGAPETEFSPSELVEIASATHLRWLSANLTDAKGALVGDAVLQARCGGLNIVVTGIIDPALVVHRDWHATDPVHAALKALAGKKGDVRIVLAYFDEAGLRNLAQALPEVDYIIGGPTGQSLSPTRVGGVRLMSATNKGKFLARLQLSKRPTGFEERAAEIAEVNSRLNEDPQQVRNLNEYYRKLSVKDYDANEAGLISFRDSSRADYAIAGSESCDKCHATDGAVWHNSKHAHAWKVLVDRQAHFDPQCQQCHTTGYGQTGGFMNVARSGPLVHVGCENCHGPSSAHVADPRKRTPYLAKEQCVRCHDHENSPEFKWDTYWAKVLHMGKRQTP